MRSLFHQQRIKMAKHTLKILRQPFFSITHERVICYGECVQRIKTPVNSNTFTIKCLFHMKSLRVVQRARIKIVARAIYTYRFFSFTYTLLFCGKIKTCCDRCFPQQIRSLRDYPSVGIGFNMNNKRHILPIVYTMIV